LCVACGDRGAEAAGTAGDGGDATGKAERAGDETSGEDLGLWII
jgi:hypothetical protein